MHGWIARWTRRRANGAVHSDAAADGRVSAALGELLDLARKTARAQARLAAVVDDLQAQMLRGLADLRRAVAEPREPVPHLDDLLDALDLLDRATDSLMACGQAASAQGLLGIAARLARVLEGASLRRVGAPGEAIDARLFRVAGTDDRAELPNGVITRVVRAAVLEGERVVREGEVFVNRRSGP